MTTDPLVSKTNPSGSFADIYNLGDVLATNTRDEQERAEQIVFGWTSCPDERRALMEMLFRRPQETVRGATGLVIRSRRRKDSA